MLVGETCSSLGDESPSDIQIRIHLSKLLCRATNALKEFDDIMKTKIGIQSTNATLTKFSWRAWAQNALRLRELSSALKTMRLDINHSLTMMTAYALFL